MLVVVQEWRVKFEFSSPGDGRRGKGFTGGISLDGSVWVLTQKRKDGQDADDSFISSPSL